MEKTPMMLKVEKRLKRPLEDAIADAYREHGTVEAAAKTLKIAPSTFYIWRLRLGISRTVSITAPERDHF